MKKATTLIVILSMLLTLFAGCASDNTTPSSEPETTVESPAASVEPSVAPSDAPPADETSEAPAALDTQPANDETPPTEQKAESKAYSFPIETDFEISVTCQISPNLANSGKLSSGNDMGWVSWLSERTGVKVNNNAISFITATEQYNLMFAAQEYTDLMQAANYTGGIDVAIEDEVFANISPYYDYMPDYANKLFSDVSYLSGAFSAEMNLVAFYGFNSTEALPDFGPHIRGDYLDTVGMDKPVTYDDLYEVLVAFKDELGVKYPLWINGNGGVAGELSGGYNVPEYTGNGAAPFYVDMVDGQYKFGPVQDASRDYLTMMNKWFSKGLIYPDFLSNTTDYPDNPTIAGGDIGVWFSYISYLKTENELLQDANSNAYVEGFSYPVLSAGDKNYFGKGALDSGVEGQGAFFVTTACDDLPLLCSVMNEFYIEEGALYGNYGIEGVTFDYDVSGDPYLNDFVNSNPDGLSVAIVMSLYFFKDGPVITDYSREYNGYTDYQKEAAELWKTDKDSMASFSILSVDESTELALIQSDLSTYYTENLIKFIVGDRSLDDWDAYVAEFYNLGLDRALELGNKGIEAGQDRVEDLEAMQADYIPY